MDVGWGAGNVEGEGDVVGLLGDEGGIEGGYAVGMRTVTGAVSMFRYALHFRNEAAYPYCR